MTVIMSRGSSMRSFRSVCRAGVALVCALIPATLVSLHAAGAGPQDDVRYDTRALLELDCEITQRACFDARIELVVQPEINLIGYYEPPQFRRRALEREAYRQLLMDRTAYTCESIGGQAALVSDSARVAVSYIVSPEEAYRSGLQPREMPRFLDDTLNLTVTTVAENRRRSGLDPASYIPDRNACWYVWHWLIVKQRWVLAVDSEEAHALQGVFSGCFPERFARISCLDSYEEPDRVDAQRGRR